MILGTSWEDNIDGIFAMPTKHVTNLSGVPTDYIKDQQRIGTSIYLCFTLRAKFFRTF